MARMHGMVSIYGVGTVLLCALAGCRSSGGGCCGRASASGGGCCGGASASATMPASFRPQTPPPAAMVPEIVSPIGQSPPSAAAVPEATATRPKPFGGQKSCPVTGDELGSMGPPIPVSVKGDVVYVCCQGCSAKVQRDPDTYLGKVRQERAAP